MDVQDVIVVILIAHVLVNATDLAVNKKNPSNSSNHHQRKTSKIGNFKVEIII